MKYADLIVQHVVFFCFCLLFPTNRFLNFVNYADIAAWELLAQAAGKRALAEYNAFSTFTDDMVSGNFDEERFKQRKMYVIKDEICNMLGKLVIFPAPCVIFLGISWGSRQILSVLHCRVIVAR